MSHNDWSKWRWNRMNKATFVLFIALLINCIDAGRPGSPASLALFRQERAAVRRERSSELEPRRLMLSCNSELELCRKPSTERFPAAACRRRGGQKCCSHEQNWQIVTRSVFVWGSTSLPCPWQCISCLIHIVAPALNRFMHHSQTGTLSEGWKCHQLK